jgi:hypothetical protein
MAKLDYSFEDYNTDDVLKIHFNLILVTVYLAKYFFIIILLPILSKIPRVGDAVTLAMPYVTEYVENYPNLIFLLVSLPAVIVIAAMFRRAPKTKSPFLRKSWTKTRDLLLISAITDIVLIALYLAIGIKTFNEIYLVHLYLDAMAVLYLWKSKRTRDVVLEFPEYKPE